MNAKILEFKKNLEAITYEDVLEHRYGSASIRESRERTSYDQLEGEKVITVTFKMTVRAWQSYRKQKSLGVIYNLDLSNYLYRKGIMTGGHPTVDDKARASKGMKTITVKFYVGDAK